MRSAADPGSVSSIEGPNEVNAQNGVSYAGVSATGPNASVADEIIQAIHAGVTADPTLLGIPIINLSLSNGVANWQTYLTDMGNMSALSMKATGISISTAARNPRPCWMT